VVLNEKGVSHDITYIDLRNRPDWFMAISPTGKVPVMQIPGDVNLFESAVINEFLDETHEPRFMSGNPLDRARIRMWRDYMADLYADVYMIYSAKDGDTAAGTAEGLRSKLARAEDEMKGPLFYGENFSMVDAAAAPAFTRLNWIRDIDPSLDVFKDLPRVNDWQKNLLERPAVKNSIKPDLFEIFLKYLEKTGTWLGSRPR